MANRKAEGHYSESLSINGLKEQKRGRDRDGMIEGKSIYGF